MFNFRSQRQQINAFHESLFCSSVFSACGCERFSIGIKRNKRVVLNLCVEIFRLKEEEKTEK